MKTKKTLLSLLLVLCMLMPSIVLPVSAGATAIDAMEAISEAFDEDYLIESHSIEDEEYIGIPLDMKIYFTKGKTATSGYQGAGCTPLIMYVVNTPLERIGTDSDVNIIRSMLERGYIVAVADYKNSPLAVASALDNSAQRVRYKLMRQGNYLTKAVFPSGTYYDCHVVPAGYNVHLNDVYWEIDKHGVDGTMEEIVELWNLDYKPVLDSKYIKWTYTDDNGNVVRKEVSDNAVWYSDTRGTVDMENGQYTLMKYAIVDEITDCVKMDGTPIDLNLYISFLYPANPKEKVPVMALHNSSEYIPNSALTVGREHFVGSVFRGYAGVVYDYAYTPMMRDNFTPGNSAGATSGDGTSYSVDVYNDKLINTAAMRYIRYKALSEPDKFKFDINAVGVFGNSKGGTHRFLGEKYVREPLVSEAEAKGLTEEALNEAVETKLVNLTPMRYLPGKSGETRYKNGEEAYSAQGVTIDAGEIQPWLTYNGEEITSGVQCIYCSCPNNEDDISEGHSPTFITLSLQDYWKSVVAYINACRVHDVPSAWFDIDLGHSLGIGPDVNHGVDTYDAFFDFFDYYLKGTPVKVFYVDPADNAVDVKTTDDILIKFNGPVSLDEVEKIEIKSNSGKAVSGKWSALYGNTEWTLTLDEELTAGDIYTVTIPGNIKGDNGVEMGSDYVYSFATAPEAEADTAFVEADNGAYITATVPDMESLSENQALNTLKIRFYASAEKAANTVDVYAVESTSATAGELLGSVQLKGEGYYDFDITEFMQNKTVGEEVVFYLKQAKEAGVFEHYKEGFSKGLGSNTVTAQAAYEVTSINGEDALKVWMTMNNPAFPANPFYKTIVNTVNNNKLIKDGNLTQEDYGRRFTISVSVYDTTQRQLTIRTETSDSSGKYETHDTQRSYYNFTTVPNEWKTYDCEYTVYEPEYGLAGAHRQKLYIDIQPDGAKESPMYIGEIKVMETVTDADITDGSVVLASNGDYAYKAPEGAENPIALYDADGGLIGEYASFKTAMNAYSYGNVVKLLKNYTFTDADAFSEFDELSAAKGDDGHIFNIDLNGYVLFAGAETKPLLWLKTTNNAISETKINLSNGTVFLKNKALVGYDSSGSISGEKKYDVNLTDVNIITDNDFVSYNILSDNTIASNCKVTTDINLTDCSVQVKNEALETWDVTMFTSGTGTLTTNCNMAGGRIKTDSLRKLTIYDSIDCVTFTANAGGVYTSLYVPESEIVPNEAYHTDAGNKTFVTNSSGPGLYKYDLIKTNLTTDYGVIPEAYADVEKYPLAVFNAAGEFIMAGADWGNGKDKLALQEAKTAGNGSVVYLRRDYEYDEAGSFANLSQVNELMTIDLGGHTINCTSSKANLFHAQAKTNHPSKVVVKNGTILAKNKTLVVFDSWATHAYTAVKDFEIAFEGITFGFSEGASGFNNLICAVNTTADDPVMNGYVSLTDCTIDLATNAPAGAYTMFNMNDKNSIIPVHTTVTGGKIIADSLENVSLVENNAITGTTLTFKKDENGNYTKLYLKDTDTIFPNIVNTEEDGRKVFAATENVDENGYTECDFGGDIIVTEYGAIPPAYKDNTFVAFIDGEVINASDYLYDTNGVKGIMHYVKEAIKGNGVNPDGTTASGAKEAVVVMLKDFTNTVEYSNIAQVNGKVTVDLNGYTLTSTNYVLATQAKQWSMVSAKVFDTHLVLKNGNVVLSKKPLAYYSSWGGSSYTGKNPKRFILDFENLNISLASGSAAANIFEKYPETNHTNDLNAEYDVTFTDCNFDLKNAKNAVTIFSATHTDVPGDISVDVTISGGSITAKSYDSVKMSAISEGADASFALEKSEAEGFTDFVLPKGASVPADKIIIGDKEYAWTKLSEAGGYVTYALGEYTKYGLLPEEYANKTFVAFIDGAAINASDYLYDTKVDGVEIKGIVHHVKETLRSNTVNADGTTADGAKEAVVLMQKDFNNTIAYPNIAQVNGKMTIDLGGNTITSTQYLLPTQAKPWSVIKSQVFDTHIVLKNGNVVLSEKSLASYSSWIGSYTGTGAKRYTLDFENLDISLAEGATVTNVFEKYSGANHTNDLDAEYDVTFKDCNFDFTNAKDAVSIFSATHTNIPADISVEGTITGGSIMAKKADAVTVASISDGANADFTWEKGDDSLYTTLILPETATAPLGTVDVNGTAMIYSQLEVIDGKITYKLIPAEYAVLSYDDAEKSAEIVIEKDGTYVILFAQYDGDKLVGINMVTATLEAGVQTVEQTADFTANKVMLWQDIKSMIPLC